MRRFSSRLAFVGLFAAIGVAPAEAATGAGAIYRCTNAKGQKVRSDRLMNDCVDDQVQLNADGSVNRVIARPMTDEERTREDTKKRNEETERGARQIEVRRDRNLLTRYPDKARHDAARKEALDSANVAVQASDARIAELTRQRKPLVEEAEFYAGKPLPAKLKSALDANDAALAAQKSLLQNQRGEVDRINKLYDDELDKLRKLWSVKPAEAPR